MKIGIDFDNTIVGYDEVFHAAAMEWGYDVTSLKVSKTVVRDHMRSLGDEERWIELQGYVYGKKVLEAAPYPGVLEFFERAKELDIELFIVSHKTKHPFKGPLYDLHKATRHWLKQLGLASSDRYGIGEERIHLELTKESKARCIARLGCDVFIDDLPEFLRHEEFPMAVRQVLFDPLEVHIRDWSGVRVKSWKECADLVLS